MMRPTVTPTRLDILVRLYTHGWIPLAEYERLVAEARTEGWGGQPWHGSALILLRERLIVNPCVGEIAAVVVERPVTE